MLKKVRFILRNGIADSDGKLVGYEWETVVGTIEVPDKFEHFEIIGYAPEK